MTVFRRTRRGESIPPADKNTATNVDADRSRGPNGLLVESGQLGHPLSAFQTTALATVPEEPDKVEPAGDHEGESDHQRSDVKPDREPSDERRYGDEEHGRQPAPKGSKQIGGPVVEAHTSTVSATFDFLRDVSSRADGVFASSGD